MCPARKFKVGYALLIGLFLFTACGPSPEELEATSAAETKSAASSTPTFSPADTAVPTPTLTPSPEPSSTPLPGPDPLAMLHWKDLDLPAGFYSIHPSIEEVEEGRTAISLELGDGDTLDYIISGSFVFVDDRNPSQILYGYAFPLPTFKHRDVFDIYTESYLGSSIGAGFGVTADSINPIPGADQIGNASAGVTAPYNSSMFGAPWQVSVISFRVQLVGAKVFLRHAATVQAPLDILEAAQVYAESLQFPQKTCQITSVNPDLTAAVPTFDFEADGFYPGEVRYIHLIGNILIGDEEMGAASMKMGGGGESFDLTGAIQDSIAFFTDQQLSDQGMADAALPAEFTLVVGGFFSGCEVEQIVTWPEP